MALKSVLYLGRFSTYLAYKTTKRDTLQEMLRVTIRDPIDGQGFEITLSKP